MNCSGLGEGLDNAVMNLQVPQNVGNFLPRTCELLRKNSAPCS